MADFGGMFPGIESYAQQQVGAQQFEADRIATASVEAELFMMDAKVAEEVVRRIDGVTGLKGAGIVFRTTWGRLRQVRLPSQSGDIGVIVTFGPRPPTGNPQELESEMRSQVTNARYSCGAATIAMVGFVVGAFISGPVGWTAIAITIFDGIAFSTGAISCMFSGIRLLNLKTGNREGNGRMDNNAAFGVASAALDYSNFPAAARNGVGITRAGKEVVREIKLTTEFANELLGAVGTGLGFAGARQGGELRLRLENLRDSAGGAVGNGLVGDKSQIRTPDYTVALTSG